MEISIRTASSISVICHCFRSWHRDVITDDPCAGFNNNDVVRTDNAEKIKQHYMDHIGKLFANNSIFFGSTGFTVPVLL